MDESFRSAYRQFTDDPSPDVWEKINAGLDKKDIASYQKRSRNRKMIVILSLLILLGYVMYEAGIIKIGFAHSKENVALAKAGKKSGKISDKQNETIGNADHFLPRKSNKKESKTIAKKSSDKIERNTWTIASLNENTHPVLPVKTKKDHATIPSVTSNSKKQLQRKDQYAPATTISVLSVEENRINEMVAPYLNQIRSAHLKNIDDSFSINSKLKSTATNHINSFEPHWAVTGYMSFDAVGYRLDKDQPTIMEIKQHEEHQPSFSAGVFIAHRFKKHWSLQSGLIYSKTSIAISPQKIFASLGQAGTLSYKYITSSGFAYIRPGFSQQPSPGDSLTAESAEHTLQHIIVPLLIHYTITKHGKLILSPGLGITGNFLISAKLETEVEDSYNREHVLVNKLDGIRSFYWSTMVDAEIRYNITGKMSMDLHPSFRYALSPLTDNNNVSTFPYSLGLGFGITYRF